MNSPDHSRDNHEQLLRQALAGNVEAFWKLMAQHERTVFAVALAVLKDQEKAEDIVHEVYIRAFSTLGNLRSPSKLSGWLYMMTRNLAHEQLRKQHREERALSRLSPRPVISVPDMLIREEELELLENAMDALPEAHRVALALKYMNNMSCREIAETLGIGLEAAKSRLFEARRVLRLHMKSAEKKGRTTPAQNKRGEHTPPKNGDDEKVLGQ